MKTTAGIVDENVDVSICRFKSTTSQIDGLFMIIEIGQ